MAIPTPSREVLWLPACTSAVSLGWLALPAIALAALLSYGNIKRRKHLRNCCLPDGRQILDVQVTGIATPEEIEYHERKKAAYKAFFDLPFSERKKKTYILNSLKRKYPGPPPFLY